MTYDLAIVGGGPAGTAAAIAAARSGATVLLVERGRYPRHKVCGEFISAESLGLLSSLIPGLSILDYAVQDLASSTAQVAVPISRARIFAEGRCAQVVLSPPGASLPRFVLDEALWRAAEQAGVHARQQTAVTGIERDGQGFTLDCDGSRFCARIVIDAAGRNSNLRLTKPTRSDSQRTSGGDRSMSGNGPCARAVEMKPGELKFLGLKAHFYEPKAMASADLYFFRGGYCGVLLVGDGLVNACALVWHGFAKTLSEVLKLNPELAERSRNWRQAIDEVRTFPAVLAPPEPVKEGLLCAGDAAAFIDPFLGDGISLALRTGETAGRIAAGSLNAAEAAERYAREYQAGFAGLFAKAARLRRLLTAPRPLRVAAMRLLSAHLVANALARATR
jgi:menaquinone-9 beta-reductase